MGHGFKHGGGGNGTGGLNFKIVGGTTVPSNPKENTIWVNTGQKITSWDFSPTEPPRRSNNKNLSVYPYDNGNTTANGVTFIPYTGGTVGVKGTATAQATFYLQNAGKEIYLKAGTYAISGAPSSATDTTYVVGLMYKYIGSDTYKYITTSSTTNFTVDKDCLARIYIQVKNGVAISSEINFKPQLERGSSATSFIKGDATGQVWITTAISSTVDFNALEENAIQVYPVSVKQVISTSWEDKTAQSYTNGSWVSW